MKRSKRRSTKRSKRRSTKRSKRRLAKRLKRRYGKQNTFIIPTIENGEYLTEDISEIKQAIINGDINEVTRLLDDDTITIDDTLLPIALRSNNKAMVELLIDSNVPIRENLITNAILEKWCDIEILELLLYKQNPINGDAFSAAVADDNTELVKLLLYHEVPVNDGEISRIIRHTKNLDILRLILKYNEEQDYKIKLTEIDDLIAEL